MIKTAAACLAALLLCTACILTKEDIDCWYDDVCQGDATGAPAVQHAGEHGGGPTVPAR